MQTTQPHIGWRIFFWFSVGVFVLAVVLEVRAGLFFHDVTEYLDFAASHTIEILALGCLYGFVNQRPIGTRRMWAAFFVIHLLYLSGSILYPLLASESGFVQGMEEAGWMAGVLVGILVLSVPLLVANYRYAFGSRALWQEGTPPGA